MFERDVTQSEQDIINARVAAQRQMFAEYEKRETTRKVREGDGESSRSRKGRAAKEKGAGFRSCRYDSVLAHTPHNASSASLVFDAVSVANESTHESESGGVADARMPQPQVKEIMDVATSVTEDEARVALEQCDGSEEQAVTALVSDPSFLRRVQSLARNARGGEGGAAPVVVVAATSGRPLGGAFVARSRKPTTKQSAPGAVFVGSFRGKLYKPAERAPAAKSKGAAATTPAASGSAVAAAEKADTDEDEDEKSADEEPVAAKKTERQQLSVAATAAAAASKAWMLCEQVARDATVAVDDIDMARLKGRRFQVEWQDGNVYRGHIASVNKVSAAYGRGVSAVVVFVMTAATV